MNFLRLRVFAKLPLGPELVFVLRLAHGSYLLPPS